MERHLNLIKSQEPETEKRVFPRFPFSYLTFKPAGAQFTFQVLDISFTGMQLCLKNGGHPYNVNEKLEGQVHWRGKSLDVEAEIKWSQGQRLGLAFDQSQDFENDVRSFLAIDQIAKSMRPLHEKQMDLELPSNLKYWLQADGPVEVFIWRHQDGEASRIHLILLDQFVEWEDGHGLKTGRIITKRDMDTPLFNEDEFIFSLDEHVDPEKLAFAKDLVAHLNERHLPVEALDFLKLKLGV